MSINRYFLRFWYTRESFYCSRMRTAKLWKGKKFLFWPSIDSNASLHDWSFNSVLLLQNKEGKKINIFFLILEVKIQVEIVGKKSLEYNLYQTKNRKQQKFLLGGKKTGFFFIMIIFHYLFRGMEDKKESIFWES